MAPAPNLSAGVLNDAVACVTSVVQFLWRRLSSVLMIALFTSAIPASLPLNDTNSGSTVILNARIDAYINHVLTEWGSSAGVAVAVVKKEPGVGWNVETKGYGVAAGDGTKVTEKTLFAIGSNSKLFTTIATGLLIHNKTISPRLAWTSKLSSVVSGFGVEDDIATKQANIIDAMSHRTGLPSHDFSYKQSDDLPAIIKKMKYLRPSAEFRDIWQYTNLYYSILSYLPTVLLPSKIPFARYVKQHIFDRLNMTSTTFSYDMAKSSGFMAEGMTRQGINASHDPFAKGISRIYSSYWSQAGEDGDFISGAGGIISNAEDMATWLQSLLQDGVSPSTNESVIPPDVLQMVATGVMVQAGVAAYPELSPMVYGGGQWRGTYRGHEVVRHSGGVTGFFSEISRFPSDGLGVAVLTNDGFYGAMFMNAIKYRIVDEALGLEPLDWNSRFKAEVVAKRASATPRPSNASLPSADLATIAGMYENPGYGSVEFCLVSPPPDGAVARATASCRQLASEIKERYPSVVEPGVPTFMARWDSPWFSHVRMTHFDRNLFNLTVLSSYATGNASEPYWVDVGGIINTYVNRSAQAEISIDGRHRVAGIGPKSGARTRGYLHLLGQRSAIDLRSFSRRFDVE